MKNTFIALTIVATLTTAACTNLERSRSLGNPAVSGRVLAEQVCSNCHGRTGVSISPNFPNLAAQTEPYLVGQLTEFRGHSRSDPAGFEYMWGLSRHLTDEQIASLAAYYAAQNPKAPPVRAHAQWANAGQKIFSEGIADQGIPPCMSCHGPQGQGNATFPRLASQHSDYLIKQLMVFQRTDERPEGSIMKTVAHGLTEQNMRDVAEYLQTLETPLEAH
ncbi:c-type cytochrome [Uliginosibacterium gangwonense]|uniref:c-type cytochrome n=1 Tax=Uliginosibacterium gangwonense TaxID=392736 RepID=UPI00037C1AE8|nr:c-type cytochrome [Uliginosibacterium gangwonense]